MSGYDYSSPDRCDAATTAHTNTPTERRRASLYIAGRAHNRDDARLLLEALGLIDTGRRWKASIHTRRRKAAEAADKIKEFRQ